MRNESIFLGIAAVLAAIGTANAACEAYGPGYVSVRGTNTCIKVGGAVQGEIDLGKALDGTPSAGAAPNGKDDAGQTFETQTDVTVTTKTMTDLGPLTTFFDVRRRGP